MMVDFALRNSANRTLAGDCIALQAPITTEDANDVVTIAIELLNHGYGVEAMIDALCALDTAGHVVRCDERKGQ